MDGNTPDVDFTPESSNSATRSARKLWAIRDQVHRNKMQFITPSTEVTCFHQLRA